MSINIENIPYYRIAYIRSIGSYGNQNIQTMEKLKKWAEAKGLLNDKAIILGIAYDNLEIVEPESCRYDTAIVISTDFCIYEDYINDGNLDGGKYAVFKIKHIYEEVQKAWSEIFHEIIKHGYQFDETRPVFERYISEMVKNHYCEICVPIH